MTITSEQSRAARGLIDWSQQDLASKCDLGLSTVRNFEKGRSQPTRANISLIAKTLEAAGVIFIPADDKGPGVRLRDKEPLKEIVQTVKNIVDDYEKEPFRKKNVRKIKL